MNLIFLFSQPRAGSTLLQRVLASHSGISTTSEPWLLLPLVYMYRSEGMLTEYSHYLCRQAISDLVKNTEGGLKTHQKAIRNYLTDVYRNVSNDKTAYFLDKTPRYYRIIREIAEIFPDAKFIFLFRNPIQVYASIIETWEKGTFHHIWTKEADLYRAPDLLAAGYQLLRKQAVSVQYEELVTEPVPVLKRLCDYLGLEYEEQMLEMVGSHELRGRMGDQPLAHKAVGLNEDSLRRWGTVFGDRFRRRLAARYIRQISNETLNGLGYNKDAILEEIRTLPVRKTVRMADVIYLIRAQVILASNAYFFFEKKYKWTRGTYVS